MKYAVSYLVLYKAESKLRPGLGVLCSLVSPVHPSLSRVESEP